MASIYVKKDPNKPMIRLYDILDNSSVSNGEAMEVYDDAAFHANGPPRATSEAVTVAANAAAAAAATGATISAAMERGTAVAATIPSIDRESAGRGGVQAEVMRTLSKQSTKKRDQHRGTTLGVRPPPKVRNALAAVNPDRVTVGVRDFSRLSKPSLPNVDKSNDITTCATGTKMYDRVNVQNEMAPKQRVDKFFLTASTVDERITIVPKIYVKVHTTGAVLVTLMCCANFSCDIFIKKIGDKLFMGKDDHTKLSVNGIGIMRCIIDNCVKQKDGIYLVKKESGKPMIRLYDIPDSTLESNGKEIKGNDGEEFRTNRPLAVTVAANVATTAATAGATTSAAMKPATAGAIPSTDRERAGRGGVQAGAMRTLSKQSTKKRDQRPGTTLGVRPPPKIRDALTAVNPERVTVVERDFPRLSKPSLPNVEKGNAITTSANDTKTYDRVSVQNEIAPQQRMDKFFLIPSTVDERITLVPKIYGKVHTTGAVLATLMCCTNFSCDIFIKKIGDKLFMAKDDQTKLSVNGIGILRCIIDNCVKQKDGIYLGQKRVGQADDPIV
nr:eukaryotic translation initiation factor 3 subunit D-like isoform X1 [Aedes albopictus]